MTGERPDASHAAASRALMSARDSGTTGLDPVPADPADERDAPLTPLGVMLRTGHRQPGFDPQSRPRQAGGSTLAGQLALLI